ncbi:hypothetical protein PsYK624_148550 [Phanerochaete sordida]|uniref:Uncharacterized protein n=1 Tax=Phanerochaete sordida TaxID=48140 RepID=A0A9P3LKK5_9APHY|nr:hypothetical protein PsYK624_148550 [Phanerochaete sordida]
MKRTGSHSITITFHLSVNPDTGSVNLRAGVFDRISKYKCLLTEEIRRVTEVTAPAMLECFTPAVAAQAIRLRSLVLLPPNAEDINPSSTSLAFPALAHLEFRAACRGLPTPLLCETLRTLVVQPARSDVWHHPDRAQGLDVLDLLPALCRMPLLESLDVSILDTMATLADSGNVPAPHLRNVRIAGAASVCTYFLQHVALPPDARLAVDCTARDFMYRGVPIAVPHAMATQLHDSHSALHAPCEAFSIEDADGGHVLCGWRRADERFAADTADVVLRCAPYELAPYLGVLLRPSTLGDVEHVRIACAHLDQYVLYNGFTEIARRAGVRNLVLDGVKAGMVLRLLPITAAASVTLMSIKFEPSGPAYAKHWEANMARKPTFFVQDQPDSVEELARLLAKETAEERAMRRLQIMRVKNVRADDVERLRPHVVELSWDGVEAMDLSYDSTD